MNSQIDRATRRLYRKFRGRSEPQARPFHRHTRSYLRLCTLSPLFYGFSLAVALQGAVWAWNHLTEPGHFSRQLWVFLGYEMQGELWLIGALLWSWILGSLLAMLWPGQWLFRLMQFTGAFFYPPLIFSSGSVGNLYHATVWASFLMVFITPSPAAARSVRHRRLLTFSTVLILLSLFYTLAAIWKIVGWLGCAIDPVLICGAPLNFPSNLVADALSKTGEFAPLAPLILASPWVCLILYLSVVWIQLISLPLAFRPQTHVWAGLMKAFFHAGTFVVVGISFSQMALLSISLFVLSPFDGQNLSWRRVAAQIPPFGFVCKYLLRTAPPVREDSPPSPNFTLWLLRAFYVTCLYFALSSSEWLYRVSETSKHNAGPYAIAAMYLLLASAIFAIARPSAILFRAGVAIGFTGYMDFSLAALQQSQLAFDLPVLMTAWLAFLLPKRCTAILPWLLSAEWIGFTIFRLCFPGLAPSIWTPAAQALGMTAGHFRLVLCVQLALGLALFPVLYRWGTWAAGAVLCSGLLLLVVFEISDVSWRAAIYAVFFIAHYHLRREAQPTGLSST